MPGTQVPVSSQLFGPGGSVHVGSVGGQSAQGSPQSFWAQGMKGVGQTTLCFGTQEPDGSQAMATEGGPQSGSIGSHGLHWAPHGWLLQGSHGGGQPGPPGPPPHPHATGPTTHAPLASHTYAPVPSGVQPGEPDVHVEPQGAPQGWPAQATGDGPVPTCEAPPAPSPRPPRVTFSPQPATTSAARSARTTTGSKARGTAMEPRA